MRRLNPLFWVLLLALASVCRLAWAQFENTELWDPKSSEHRSGVKTPRMYYIPPAPAYEKVDLKEFDDYHKERYSPYAQLQVYRPIQIGPTKLNQGYYLVKLDAVKLPPPGQPPEPVEPKPDPNQPERVQMPEAGFQPLHTIAHVPAAVGHKTVTVAKHLKPSNPFRSRRDKKEAKRYYPEVDPDAAPEDQEAKVSFIIKKMGSMELVIPVYASERPKEEVKDYPTAKMVVEDGDPIHPYVLYLKYCGRRICYRTAPLEPGLIQ